MATQTTSHHRDTVRQVSVSVEIHHPDTRSVVLSMSGELDLAALPRLRELLKQRMAAAVDTVVLDLSALAFCDSSGVELLCEVDQRAAATGITLRLVPCRCVDRVLSLTGYTDRFRTAPTVSRALAA